MFACKYQSVECFNILLEHGCNIFATNVRNETAIFYAAFSGSVELLKALLDAGANPHERNTLLQTPLIRASYRGNADAVQLLLDHKADPLALDDDNVSPVLASHRNNHTDVVEVLLDNMMQEHGVIMTATQAREMMMSTSQRQEDDAILGNDNYVAQEDLVYTRKATSNDKKFASPGLHLPNSPATKATTDTFEAQLNTILN
jgi:ankyrin repeat protein